MSTSATRLRQPYRILRRDGRPLVAFVIGRYFATFPDGTTDFNGISANIKAVQPWAVRLWEAGVLVFTPHFNTHHFESKTRIDPDPQENEEYYRAFDRKIIKNGVDFCYGTPNTPDSTGGRDEVQLCNHLDIPVLPSLRDLAALLEKKPYLRIVASEITEKAKHFGEGKNLPIVLVDGPHWAQEGAEPDIARIEANEYRAEEAAIRLFENRIGAFTPQLNASYTRLGYRVPLEAYHLLNEEVIRRNVVDAVYLAPGWEDDAETRKRITLARELGKPVFDRMNEALAWRDGKKFFGVSTG